MKKRHLQPPPHMIKGRVWHFGKYAYLLYCWNMDSRETPLWFMKSRHEYPSCRLTYLSLFQHKDWKQQPSCPRFNKLICFCLIHAKHWCVKATNCIVHTEVYVPDCFLARTSIFLETPLVVWSQPGNSLAHKHPLKTPNCHLKHFRFWPYGHELYQSSHLTVCRKVFFAEFEIILFEIH